MELGTHDIKMESQPLTSVDLSTAQPAAVEPQPATERFVTFQLGAKTYCVPTDTVAEISHPLETTPLPLSPPSVLGICSIRGTIVAVTDLRSLLGEQEPGPDAKPKFIVFRSAVADSPVAVPIDRVHDVVAISRKSFIEPASRTDRFISASANEGGNAIHLLDIEQIRCELSPASGN